MSDIGIVAEETNRMLIDRFCRDIANEAQRYGATSTRKGAEWNASMTS